jgi:putative colanic acid biosysnthesis UDP-glucose lipid carrier transferase
VVGLCETPFTGINAIGKRISDVVLSLAILALTAPLMLAIAVGVKLSSPGPVLFVQRRNGLDGSEIFVYKFRTMRVMENGSVVRQATRSDERVTPLGRLLRRTSMDEMPQFINVLQGRMSIVGPRPHAVVHNELYRRQIKGYMVRHKARPGITGWAQINGYRGETDSVGKMKERAALDLEYLRNWSLGLDLTIMWRTLRLIVHDTKAY